MPQGSAFGALVQAVAGAAGGVVASSLLMPLEIVKIRVQISQHSDATMLNVFLDILKTEGIAGLFRGVVSKSSETGSKNFVFFYIYDAINRYAKLYTRVTSSVSLVLGYIAGLGTTMITMPLEVVATRQQLMTSSGNSGVAAVVGDIMKTDGWTGLFKGFWFNVLLCINPAIQNTCFDRIKDLVLMYKSGGDKSKRLSMTPLEAFILGAFAKAIATVVTFPMVRLKTMLQAGSAPEAEGRRTCRSKRMTHASSKELIRVLSYKSDVEPTQQSHLERFNELYRGMAPALLKGVLQAALLYMTKDQVAKVVAVLLKQAVHLLRPGKSRRHKLRALSGRALVE